jgi:hypothetical protein
MTIDLTNGFPSKQNSILYVVCRDNGVEGYSEPLFATWTKEDADAWVKATNVVAMMEAGFEDEYVVTLLNIKLPEPLYAFYENGMDPVKRRFLWKWDESRCRNV